MRIQICYSRRCEPMLTPVTRAIEGFYGLRTFMNTRMEPIPPAYDASRKQYDAAPLLECLTRVKESDVALWIIDQDIYCRGMDYIFGYALKNYGAVLSSFRLNSEELVKKEAAHEVGHVLGLKHCDNRCLMRYSGNLEEAKAKPMKLCEACQSRVKLPGAIKFR